jgi:hypothetical protein
MCHHVVRRVACPQRLPRRHRVHRGAVVSARPERVRQRSVVVAEPLTARAISPLTIDVWCARQLMNARLFPQCIRNCRRVSATSTEAVVRNLLQVTSTAAQRANILPITLRMHGKKDRSPTLANARRGVREGPVFTAVVHSGCCT